MNSRERVLAAINHEEPDRVPVDLGGSLVSGIMAGALVRLQRHLGLDHTQVQVYDAFQMLGEVASDLVETFKVDMLPVEPEAITFDHLRNRAYKPWTLFDGTEVLVPGAFEVEIGPKGDWLLHEDGDPEKPILGRMPKDGFYFDTVTDLDWNPDYTPPNIESLRKSDWRRVQPETLAYLKGTAEALRATTNKALVLTNWGDAVLGPARVGTDPEWLILLATEPIYLKEMMDLAAEIAVDNLKLYWDAIGKDIDIIHLDGYDYGAQDREMFSPKLFVELYEPCYKAQCDWIHTHTPWKVAKHCCGSIPNLMEPMVRAGIDLINPVQASAAGMDPGWLKSTFGDQISFWGGGVDTQRVLPFGSPEEVYEHVRERIQVFMPGGGFIWAAIHNIQYTVPPENIVAAIQAVHDYGRY